MDQTNALAIPGTEQQLTTAPREGALNAFSSEAAFVTAQRMAKGLAASTMVPAAYQGNIPNCMIAIELASRIGASVFMVMQSLDIIQGRPSWRAQFLIATVNASGRFTPLRFRFTGQPGTKTWGCVAHAKDRQSGELCEGAEITIQMAFDEGWATKNGSKWRTMPQQMLMYRAAAFWARVYAPELSLGIHTAEEIIDVTGEAVARIDAGPSIPAGSAQALEAALLGEGTPKVEDNVGEPAPVRLREPGED